MLLHPSTGDKKASFCTLATLITIPQAVNFDLGLFDFPDSLEVIRSLLSSNINLRFFRKGRLISAVNCATILFGVIASYKIV